MSSFIPLDTLFYTILRCYCYECQLPSPFILDFLLYLFPGNESRLAEDFSMRPRIVEMTLSSEKGIQGRPESPLKTYRINRSRNSDKKSPEPCFSLMHGWGDITRLVSSQWPMAQKAELDSPSSPSRFQRTGLARAKQWISLQRYLVEKNGSGLFFLESHHLLAQRNMIAIFRTPCISSRATVQCSRTFDRVQGQFRRNGLLSPAAEPSIALLHVTRGAVHLPISQSLRSFSPHDSNNVRFPVTLRRFLLGSKIGFKYFYSYKLALSIIQLNISDHL